MEANSIGSYLKYAFGEVILVVIGILIALAINNWNNEKVKARKLNNVITQVVTDLKTDTTNVGYILRAYEPLEKPYLDFINDSVTIESLDSCQNCLYIISGFEPFTPNTSGYNLLNKLNFSLKTRKDSLILTTSNVYAQFSDLFALMNRNIEKDVSSNLNYLKMNHSWYADWMNGTPTEEVYNFMLTDPVYKNMVSHYHILVYDNFLGILEKYSQAAAFLIKELEPYTDN